VNANPNDRVVGPGGVPWRSDRKDVANTSVPADSRCFPLTRFGFGREQSGSQSVGSWSAMMVGLWVLDARPAQGRVGEFSRHIAFLLVSHLLLSDEASGRTELPRDRSARLSRRVSRSGDPLVPRRWFRTTVRPPRQRRDLSLNTARAGDLARFAPCREPSRGKGDRSA